MGRPILALDETLGKAPPLPYFSPTPRPQSVKIVSNVWRTPRMYLWGSHQREGSFVKVVERALPRSVRPAGLKKAEDRLASPGGGMPRNRLGETPAQSSPLTSNSRVNNLPQSALETHKRCAAVGWRGWDAEPARKAASRRAQSQPLREACTEVRGRVCFQLLLGWVDHHRRPPNSLELALPPWERQTWAAG